jgi:hypothetical protein
MPSKATPSVHDAKLAIDVNIFKGDTLKAIDQEFIEEQDRWQQIWKVKANPPRLR